MGTGKTYTEEFKKAAIARLANETTTAVSTELKVAKSLLRNWKTKSDLGLPLSKGGKREKYSPEFKVKAVARAQRESIVGASKALKVPAELIRRWAREMPAVNRSKSYLNKKTYSPELLKRKAVVRIATKKNYYIPVAQRAAMLTEKRQAGGTAEDVGGRKLLRTVHACVGMLRQIRGQANNSDPVHLTAMLVLATLEGKM